jgi:D-3-phosphoglycerate dehydrogenase
MLALAREIRADAGMKQGQVSGTRGCGVERQDTWLDLLWADGAKWGSAAAFGMNVVAYDPLIPEDEIKARREPVSIQILRGSDFISLHFPLNVQTRDMTVRWLSERRMACASARARRYHRWRGIGRRAEQERCRRRADVFGQEPPGLTETVSHPRVIASPHIGAQTAEAQARASEDIATEVLSALNGKPLRWKVN